MRSEALNIDCMDYMRGLEDNAFSLAIVDPPFGLKAHGAGIRGAGQMRSRPMNTMPMQWDVPPTQEYFDELFRVSENQIIMGGNYFNLPPTRGFVVWDKKQPLFNFSKCDYIWTSFSRTSELFAYRSSEKRIHPTQKPVKLYEYLLTTFAKQGDTILDTHLGSGSSRIAAYKLGFDFVGCELDKGFFDCQEKRFNDFINNEKIKQNGNNN